MDNESTSNAQSDDNTLCGDLNSGPSSLDEPAPDLDADAEAATWFYEVNGDDAIEMVPDKAVVVLIGITEDTGSLMFKVMPGSKGETPFDNEEHYSAEILERVLPLRQDDGSVKIGFTPKPDGPTKAPGSYVHGYLDANNNKVANALAVIRVVPGLQKPIWAVLTKDLLEALPTLDIQHNESYFSDATMGQILELVVPLHSGYAENQNRYATVEPLGLLMQDDPNPTGDNSLRYWVRPDAKSIGLIDEPFMRACGNDLIFSPTVVVIRAKEYLKSVLYRIKWECLTSCDHNGCKVSRVVRQGHRALTSMAKKAVRHTQKAVRPHVNTLRRIATSVLTGRR